MYEIPISNLIANYHYFTKNNYISNKDIKHLRKEIEAFLSENGCYVYVAITYDDVDIMKSHYPNLFKSDQFGIIINMDDIFFDEKLLEKYFNWSMPIDIKQQYIKYFEEKYSKLN